MRLYLRTTDTKEKVNVELIMAKTKLADMKTVSVGKLKLNATVLGARLAKYVEEGMSRKVDQRFFRTDSSCVRNRIRGGLRHRCHS